MSIEQQIELQSALQQLGLLTQSDSINEVFGTATRAAISTWQNLEGRAATGLLGNSDAQALLQSTP